MVLNVCLKGGKLLCFSRSLAVVFLIALLKKSLCPFSTEMLQGYLKKVCFKKFGNNYVALIVR